MALFSGYVMPYEVFSHGIYCRPMGLRVVTIVLNVVESLFWQTRFYSSDFAFKAPEIFAEFPAWCFLHARQKGPPGKSRTNAKTQQKQAEGCLRNTDSSLFCSSKISFWKRREKGEGARRLNIEPQAKAFAKSMLVRLSKLPFLLLAWLGWRCETYLGGPKSTSRLDPELTKSTP